MGLLSSKSREEKLVEHDPSLAELHIEVGNKLNRRTIPTLIVQAFGDNTSPIQLIDVRMLTVVIQHRLNEHHPDVASKIYQYDFEPSNNGPQSEQFTKTVLEMVSEDWSKRVPLGAKTKKTFGGNIRTNLYNVDTTNDFLDDWFDNVDIPRDVVTKVVKETVEEFQVHNANHAWIPHDRLKTAAVKTDQRFMQASSLI